MIPRDLRTERLLRYRRSRAVMERLGLTYRGVAHWHDHDVVWHALDR